MRSTILLKGILLLCAGLLLIGAGPKLGPGGYLKSDPVACDGYEDDVCIEFEVTGHSRGNHELDCTVIQPIAEHPTGLYPIIVWANGWGWNDNAGEDITAGYKPGLIEWALDGPYIVVAANQWSVQESDVLQCLQWVIDKYEVAVDYTRIGLSGHSQGGGAIIKAGDGEPNGFEITATIPMNPYGPGWVRPGNQVGPMLLIGGTEDTTTPTASFLKVWNAIQGNEIGGVLAEVVDGTHNDDAWGPSDELAPFYNFSRYQDVTELWWQIHLNDKGNLADFENFLISEGYWLYDFTDGYDL